MSWISSIWRRIGDWVVHHAVLLTDPESMVGWFIVTMWCVLAGLQGGVVVMLILLVVGWFLHFAAVESGNHVLLWMTTSMLLLLIVIASELTLGTLSPVLLAAAGTTALVHNELVRLNYTRRRNAVVHESVYHGSGVALAVSGAIAVVGVALTQIFADGGQRSWLWMPVAATVLMLIGFGLALGPLRKATEASKERWMPGDRIPPQPLKTESTDF